MNFGDAAQQLQVPERYGGEGVIDLEPYEVKTFVYRRKEASAS